ncbi:retroviral-like aspartic protease 1 [Mercenaria mercenaria]|uniref:retroviral-like aspartic protease 1 n=1 Tax=Mercenaria mercenaria TaxID=6596 RepID=UPI00234E7840|nr:retroviral-like aspartic protease 1 [Mercenaria mercenaria]
MSRPANNLNAEAATTRDLSDGINVQGSVGNVPATFTVDTGAARSVLSHEVYQKIKDGERPTLRGSVGLRRAGGTEIRERGRGIFNLTMGPVTMEYEMVVADIEDDALLGCDVLAGSKAGPADIILSKKVIVLEGKEIPCIPKVRRESTRKVAVDDDVTLPDETEALPDVYIEKS